MEPQLIDLTHPNAIRKLSLKIHQKGRHLWQIEKANEGVPKWVMIYKDEAYRKEKARKLRNQIAELRAQRQYLYQKTPKKDWYPNFKNCGRRPNDSEESKILSQVMKDAFNENFKVKSIANYFKVSESVVYKRIKMKKIAG